MRGVNITKTKYMPENVSHFAVLGLRQGILEAEKKNLAAAKKDFDGQTEESVESTK